MTDADAPFLHEASGTIRFWVELGDGRTIGASVTPLALHHCFRPDGRNEDPFDTFRLHLPAIEAAVRRRIHAGSREPIMLREYDLRPPGR